MGSEVEANGIIVVNARNVCTETATLECCNLLRGHTLAHPEMLLVFGGGKHSPEILLRTIAREYPRTCVVGGAAAGVITTAESGYSGSEIGMVAFMLPEICPRLYFSDTLAHGDFAGGRELGKLARAGQTNDAAVLMLYDSVLSVAPRRLHVAGALLRGFQSEWGERAEVVGGGLLTDLNLTDGWMLIAGEVRRHAAAALVFPSSVAVETVILHACRPMSAFMTITQIEGAEIFTLDGRRALDVIEEQLDFPLTSEEGHPNRIMTLGLKLGDQWAGGTPDDYVNRLILTANREVGSITLFEPDFYEGALVQLMQNDSALMIDSARTSVAAATRPRSDGTVPFLRLYIDCAGRASVMSGTTVEEADVVTSALQDKVPFLGFYSGVEIAPLRGVSRPLDWTGVLTTFRVKAQ